MQNPASFYKMQLERHQTASKKIFKKLSLLSVLRLAVFLLTALGVYISFENWRIAAAIAVVGIIGFLYLLSVYTDLKAKRNIHKRLVAINNKEIEIAKGKFYERPDGETFQDPSHFFSLDIDLFGKGSFFQYSNRTALKEGTEKFSKMLLSNNTEGITDRQEAIKELAALPAWRQNYEAVAQGVQIEHSAASIISWLKTYQPFLGKTQYILTLLYAVASVVLIGLGVAEIIPISIAGYWLLLGLGITGRYLKQINNLSQHTERAKDTFKQYALLLKAIESTTFKAPLLTEKQKLIQSEALKASAIFSKFSKTLDALENRNNLISAVFGNGFLLVDIRNSYHVEQWIAKYGHKVDDWFEVVTFFDALNSFGNYAFNHQSFTYPIITDQPVTIKADGLGHPLLNAEKRVNSDLILEEEQFFIVTGANMAGKSTFLRTVALHIVMANVGLPICAQQSKYKPIKLITSMRTTDSLTDDSSYFFSELTRLKFVVDTIAKDKNYFVILDEILKGTNSTDKAIGSRKFVEKLVKQNATGIIATHDLSLTEIENELTAVKNYYFDAEIINDELFFDYKLKQGVCQNMNASFLLKKMEII